MLTQQLKNLLTVLCSSYSISRFHNEGKDIASIANLATDMMRLEDSYEKSWNERLKEFDGYTIEQVDTSAFQRRLQTLKDKWDEQAQHIKRTIPTPLVNESDDEEVNELITNDEFYKQIDTEIVQKWYTNFRERGGKKCFQFNHSDLQELYAPLKKLAMYTITYNAMEKVADITALEGQYRYSTTFKSVPDACRWLDKKYDQISFKKILADIKSRKITIKENDTTITDSDKLYKRTYSWYRNQNDKGAEIPFD